MHCGNLRSSRDVVPNHQRILVQIMPCEEAHLPWLAQDFMSSVSWLPHTATMWPDREDAVVAQYIGV